MTLGAAMGPIDTDEPDDHVSRAAGGDGVSSQRLDKWLWFARIARSRTLAQSLIAEGKIRVNRQRVDKSSHPVKPGDVITSSIKRSVRVLEVLRTGSRRGPASEAATLYHDLTAPPEPREASVGEPSVHAEREPGSGRPTKRDRRRIDRLIGG